ncbi:MAG TPA: ribonuclease R [Chthoniobacterales bacterium]|jgi:ribonuclease R|nr:ribonuclease R [Chthoniobacterales bacterium]
MKRDADTKQRILALLRAPKYRPLDKKEMARALGFKSENRTDLKQALRELERAGEIARIRKNRYILPSEADLVTGKIQIHQAGFGFLAREGSDEGDIFISAENTGTAMNGDRVVARITRDADYARARGGSSRPEGRVIRILERAHDTIVGTLQQTRNFFYVVPDDPRMVHNVYVQPRPLPAAPRPPQPNDKVVVRLEPWESRHVNPEGEIVELLGRASDPGVDMLSIIRKYNLPLEFPEAVLAEANQIPDTVDPDRYREREDLRNKFIVTIDPDDARDFDDAINVERLPGGEWELGVHIADVSAYVTPGSALDREALKRGNSVYLVDRVIPMLPERLSNGVCSLNPNVVRLTHSVFIRFAKNGAARSARFARTTIQSASRLTYREAYAIMQKPPHDELSHRLHTAWDLASILRRRRFAHGSLDLDFPEVKVVVDKQSGRPLRLERIENDESHQLIEEFMLAANEAVASELKNRLVPAIYRVHEDPDPDKLSEYREFVISYGFQAGDLTHRKELQRLLASFAGKPEEQALKIGLLKSLKRARYATQPLGHYGLSKNNYTHFTSPIRRYADLVVHRTLADRDAKRSGRRSAAELAGIAEHISATERVAAEAEIESGKMKKLEFLQLQLTEKNPQVFRAVVIEVRNYGLLIELPEVLLTGLVHVSSLQDDFYIFDGTRRRLIGRQSKRVLAVGDVLKVVVARIDVFKRQADFAIVEEGRRTAQPAPTSRRRRR